MSAVSTVEYLSGFIILVGLIGIIAPFVPGSILIATGVTWWMFDLHTQTSFIVGGVCLALLAFGTLIKYLVPGKKMKSQGITNSSLLIGSAGGFIGMFILPFLGLFIGFVVGIYLSERSKHGEHAGAWSATKQALAAVGISMLIELIIGVLVTFIWFIAVFMTATV